MNAYKAGNPSRDSSIGGVVGYVGNNDIVNLYSSGIVTGFSNYANNIGCGGIVGYADTCNIEKCLSEVTIRADSSYQLFCGGIVGFLIGNMTKNTFKGIIDTREDIRVGGIAGSAQGIVEQCWFDGIINANSNDYTGVYICGIVGYGAYSTLEIKNCLAQGTININEYYDDGYNQYFAGICDAKTRNATMTNNIANLEIINNTAYEASIVGIGYGMTSDEIQTNYYNSAKTTANVSTAGAKTDDDLNNRATYSAWADFDTYWIINEKLNNGYPMLKCFLSSSKVTGFDGSGTQSSPYQIKTTADLQGMQAYYNEYDLIDEYYWKLVNNIDITKDANNIVLNWTPIGYESGVMTGVNGHFDGNGKTISGLTITEQYENVGLFGRLANNATITNLNVTGTISWDQAKYVGGIVGFMEDGAILTNCSFTGTITGYLNSGNIAVVGGLAGKYGTDAITGGANYDCYVYGTDNYTTFNRYDSTYSVV